METRASNIPVRDIVKKELEKYSDSENRAALKKLILDIPQNIEGFKSETVLVGALIYVREVIASEYSRFSYKISSKLYEYIDNTLKEILKELPTDAQALIYLAYFLEYSKYVKKNQPNQYKNVDVSAIIKDRLLKRMSTDINEILKRSPTQEVLINSMHTLSNEYKGHCAQQNNSWWPSLWKTSSRSEAIKFIDAVNAVCEKEICKCNEKVCKCKKEDLETLDNKLYVAENPQKLSIGYCARAGAILYVIARINQEAHYKLKLSSTENSYLRELCKKTLNMSSTSDISNQDKLKYLEQLLHIAENYPKTLASALQEQGLSADNFMLNFKQNLKTVIEDLKKLINSPHYTPGDWAEYAVSSAVSLSAATVIGTYSTDYYDRKGFSNLPTISVSLASYMMSPTTAMWWAPCIYHIARYAIPATYNQAITTCTTGVIAWTSETLGRGSKTVVNTPYYGAQRLHHYLYAEKNAERAARLKKMLENEALLRTLYELPNDTFPDGYGYKNIKHRIENIIKPQATREDKTTCDIKPTIAALR